MQVLGPHPYLLYLKLWGVGSAGRLNKPPDDADLAGQWIHWGSHWLRMILFFLFKKDNSILRGIVRNSKDKISEESESVDIDFP